MAKNIVLCSDGTGNTAVKARGTNVFKLYEAIDIQGHKHDPGQTPQVAYYDDGVGTSSLLPLKVIGGAFGFGFGKNVRDLYTELAHVYEPGDRIYLFGFSRGAYTVRALSGLIHYCGIPDIKKIEHQELAGHIRHCWRQFRGAAFKRVSEEQRRRNVDVESGQTDRARRETLKAVMHETHAPDGAVPIEFIGVWDTVGAIGTPFEELRTAINWIWPMRFTELTPSKAIKRACHALSIDDDRRTFFPELWNEQGGTDPRVSQVWFAGAHSNVGGGYVKHGMSLVALDWMMVQAEQCGLRFIPADREFVRTHQDVHDHLYDPRSGFGVYYRWQPRDIYRLCQQHQMPVPKIHVSVLERIANGTDSYLPANVPYRFEVVRTQDSQRPVWPSAEKMEDLKKALVTGQALWKPPAEESSLLDRLQGVIREGKLSYRLFVILSLPFLALWGFLAAPEWMQKLVHERLWEGQLGKAAISGLVFLLLGGGVWEWARRVDARIEATAKQYWQLYRAELQGLFRTRETSMPTTAESQPAQPVGTGQQ